MARPDGYVEMQTFGDGNLIDAGYVAPTIPGATPAPWEAPRSSGSFKGRKPAPLTKPDKGEEEDEEQASPTQEGTSFWAFLGIELSCVMFVMLFNTQAVLVKVMNKQFIFLPWTVALWFTAAWPLGFLIELAYLYIVKKKPRPITFKFIRNMIFLGFLDALQYGFISWAVNFLPVSTYMLLKTSSLVFNLVLGWALLQKKIFKVSFMLAALFTLAAIVLVMFEDDDKDPLVTPAMHYVACGMSVASSLLGSVHVALSQRLLKGIVNTNKARGLLDFISYDGLFSFLFLLPFPFIFGEYKEWYPDIHMDISITFAVIGISVSKLFAVLCKFIVAKNTTALIAGTLDMTRRVGVIVLSLTLFGESFELTKTLALGAMVVALLLYIWGARNKETDNLDVLLAPMPSSPRNRMSLIKATWTAINEPEPEMPAELMESLLAGQALTGEEVSALSKALDTPFF